MGDPSLHRATTALLREHNARGNYSFSLLCTEQGLPFAAAGQGLDPEVLSAVASLFDEVVRRAIRDIGLRSVEELTLLDPGRGRLVIRPLKTTGDVRMFLVVAMDPKLTWRRNTHLLCSALEGLFAQMTPQVEPETP